MSVRYSERLGEAGISPSVGSTGDAYGNALAEIVNGLYKTGVSHIRPLEDQGNRGVLPWNGRPGSIITAVGTHRGHSRPRQKSSTIDNL